MHACQARRPIVWVVLAAGVIALAAPCARAQTGAESSVGYIDSAIPVTQFRQRYDAGFDMNRPDRAEFFYAEWHELSFHPHGIQGDGVFFDPKARGPDVLPGKLNYQEASSYVEIAYNNRLSGFVELPVRFVDFDNLQEDPDHERKPGGGFFPEPRGENTGSPHTNLAGLSDIVAGFKAALLADPNQYVTFQFRTYIPTGDPSRGLGTGHVSLEPGLLLYERLTDRLTLEGQFRDWIPVDGGKAAGNILIYGLGVGYDVYHCDNFRVTPIVEFVGWTVLNGFESFFGLVSSTPPPGIVVPTSHGVEDASGDTIVNAKFGVRTYFNEHSDVYVGYGQALTGDRWYRDIARVEYRLRF
ncbi:MAG TPA: hypothetical protein VG013_27690 [Gemmataceae bacterium]|jgi:hypothetical protein|nr:hypothetical protein [Gemmataceae bacterium]